MSWLRRKIRDTSTISAGVPFRTRVENESDGGIFVIQARDITGDGAVDLATAAKVTGLPGSTEVGLLDGDVLLQPRGTRYSAGLLRLGPIPAAAAAPLLILRCNPAQIVPEFLVLFLRLPATQAVLRNSATGTYIPQVPRAAVGDLLVDLPSLANQRKLVEFAGLQRLEGELLDLLNQKRQRLLELAVRELAKKDRGRESAAGPNSIPEVR